ncbi:MULTISPECIES: phenylacetic acid degradation protein PaaY [Thauera]|uniref:Phenylacetic acid degradation protein PaaY-like n=2 Tax=Thauera TaxID=33057 RepID=A0A2R4BLN9_THAAR|nr:MULTISPECIES: phenylacetic acid degradation protein PaaY [Thauera]APR04939.1 Phenylacetic acid degradation protein PaaY-like [Thauera chlorobenzoica]AVR88182.1 Phenylacetic acid degradation protein PaaY-like [Thauera aromatica K172]MCK2095042.1 phenylacetic acid degradation protein PaaY [Thauera aromatica]MCK2125346.1 phenylacetic acid degradation protein PaaY [Thauera aromatica]SEF46367.1 phenylacetic acid degradation protein [Thauera chlorobenzoica]
MPCYEIDGVRPVIHPTAFVHPDAVLIGDVFVGPGCYVAPQASLRGDFGRIVLEEGSNVQDACVLHGFPEIDTVVEQNGHIGHAAVLHACRVGRNALIGMNAVVMDYAEIGEGSIVAACAFVKAEMKVPPGMLVAGVPAKVLRPLTDQERAWKIVGTECYHALAARSLATLKPCEPLREADPERRRFEMPDIVPLSEARRRAG